MHANVILVLSYMATLFPVYIFPTAFSTAFTHYYTDPQTNTITSFRGRNTQHIFICYIKATLHISSVYIYTVQKIQSI